MLFIHNDILSAKKYEILPFATTWLGLTGVKLRNISQRRNISIVLYRYVI